MHARVARVAAAAPRVLLLAGGPGAGKGSVAERLAGWEVVSAGALLRRAALDDQAVAETLRRGDVVPGAVSAAEVLRWMDARLYGARAPGKARWAVDGFPRSLDGARVWEELGGPIWYFLEIVVRRTEMERRLAGRGREDDEVEIVRKRIDQHEAQMPALREFYRERGLYDAVDGEGELCDVVELVKSWIDARDRDAV
jgi:adenylate kinase family enzyme